MKNEIYIPLSEIVSLAITQCCTYYLESRECISDMRSKHENKKYYDEMAYWDGVEAYLQSLRQKVTLHPD